MKNNKTDPRARYTQSVIRKSLLKLLAAKSLKNVTVAEICREAQVTRGTFYNHYTDTYDLLQKMESDVLADFQDMIDNFLCSSKNGSLMPILLPVIQYIEENVKIARILFENSASSDFVYRFHQLISDNGTAIFKKQYPGIDDVSLSYFIEFITFGLTGVLRCWINNGMKESKEKIAEIADKSAMQVVQNLWGH